MLLFHNNNCPNCTQRKRVQYSHGFPMLVWAWGYRMFPQVSSGSECSVGWLAPPQKCVCERV